ncbi:hypothetical protein [Marininema halotolerans]|uniref:hypothetical protein n=1 Tax=Marininema halotolerans TaxID=1155944 RepID=UPI000B83DED8|nr:hypothetical protein [Marininema halotolerans]
MIIIPGAQQPEIDWVNQLIIPLGADLGVFILKALVVALLASWVLKKYVQPLFKSNREHEKTEKVDE